jgi:hypothetical protein
MKVGILGSGAVGMSVGEGVARTGHDVMVGSRTPDKADLREWKAKTKGDVTTGSFAEAAAHGEAIILCPLGAAAESVVDLADPKRFEGKVVIDVTNPLDFSKGMPPALSVGTTGSLGERIQRKLPKAKVVKCFNIVNHRTMISPRMEEGLPDMMICGNDEGAKRQVAAFLRELGWGEPIDLGGIESARWLEALTALWVRAAMKVGSWSIAFKMLR